MRASLPSGTTGWAARANHRLAAPRPELGLANLVTNIRRLLWLERQPTLT